MKTDPWEWLRFQLRTADLLILAELLGVDVSGIPRTTGRKECLAKRIWFAAKGVLR